MEHSCAIPYSDPLHLHINLSLAKLSGQMRNDLTKIKHSLELDQIRNDPVAAAVTNGKRSSDQIHFTQPLFYLFIIIFCKLTLGMRVISMFIFSPLFSRLFISNHPRPGPQYQQFIISCLHITLINRLIKTANKIFSDKNLYNMHGYIRKVNHSKKSRTSKKINKKSTESKTNFFRVIYPSVI